MEARNSDNAPTSNEDCPANAKAVPTILTIVSNLATFKEKVVTEIATLKAIMDDAAEADTKVADSLPLDQRQYRGLAYNILKMSAGKRHTVMDRHAAMMSAMDKAFSDLERINTLLPQAMHFATSVAGLVYNSRQSVGASRETALRLMNWLVEERLISGGLDHEKLFNAWFRMDQKQQESHVPEDDEPENPSPAGTIEKTTPQVMHRVYYPFERRGLVNQIHEGEVMTLPLPGSDKYEVGDLVIISDASAADMSIEVSDTTFEIVWIAPNNSVGQVRLVALRKLCRG